MEAYWMSAFKMINLNDTLDDHDKPGDLERAKPTSNP